MPASSHRYRTARRLAAAVIGGTLLALGTIMLATPGPGTPVIAAGLGVLLLPVARGHAAQAPLPPAPTEPHGGIRRGAARARALSSTKSVPSVCCLEAAVSRRLLSAEVVRRFRRSVRFGLAFNAGIIVLTVYIHRF